MIKIELTENYTGFKIKGTYNDFYELYENIESFFTEDKYENVNEDNMCLHIYGFLYDLRHAYQGDRFVIVKNNHLDDEAKKYYGIDKNIKK